jgi:ribonucleoside-diphosphate reductase alpha chain
MTICGPTVPFCEEVHSQKYRSEGESFREAINRVASALQDDDEHFHKIQEIMLDMRFMPGGRIQTAMGSTKNVTPYSCFVIPIEDSFVDGSNSIMNAATNAATTMRMGGGVGYDFSSLRPRGSLIKKLQSLSSGPISFMHIYDAVCRATASSGHRRGAQMSVLRVDHPDIEEFIHAKNNQDKLTGFNTSIAITDEFMAAVISGKKFALRFGGEVYRFVDAFELWENIMRSTWDWAEPGVLFIDQINRMNNLWYIENLVACNPCSEQPLPPFGACLLGSFNLVKYLVKDKMDGRWKFDYARFGRDISPIVRMMDNVVDRAIYPMDAQYREAISKRRMGLGITGLANAGEALGYTYGSAEFVQFENTVLQELTECAYRASVNRAIEKGPFPLFDKEKYCAGNFIKSLSIETRAAIYEHGIRNSHLTSIAPTGTISFCADNVSSGIEPVFAYEFDRSVIEFGGVRTEKIQDYGVKFLGVHGKRSMDITAAEHINVLATAQRWSDSSVSKTVNMTGAMPWEDFKGIYLEAWKRGAKGCATFNSDGKRAGMLVAKEDQAVSCTIGPDGKKDCG